MKSIDCFLGYCGYRIFFSFFYEGYKLCFGVVLGDFKIGFFGLRFRKNGSFS